MHDGAIGALVGWSEPPHEMAGSAHRVQVKR